MWFHVGTLDFMSDVAKTLHSTWNWFWRHEIAKSRHENDYMTKYISCRECANFMSPRKNFMSPRRSTFRMPDPRAWGREVQRVVTDNLFRDNLFVCLFVCLYKTRKSILRSLCFEGSNNPWEWLHTESGAVAQKLIRHGPRAWHWRQRHKPRTCQSVANTLQVDGLARITGLTPAPIQRRILNHRNNHPHHAHVSSWHVYGMGRT